MKDEAYYVMTLEEVCSKKKNLSLVAKGHDDEDETYQIWSHGSDDEEMCHPTHESCSQNMLWVILVRRA